MTTILVASSEPRAGRSLVAAAIAYRLGRAGKAVTLARLAGDDGAQADAATFAALDGIVAARQPLTAAEAASLTGDAVIEAPAGEVQETAASLGARVIAVGTSSGGAAPLSAGALAGVILTRVPAADVAALAALPDVLATWPEDHILAAPSVADIASALDATWLRGRERSYTIDRVMIGTVASDAASPYFAERRRTCVITRFDKTDIQLAALLTDLQCLVITGGGEPSPYLLDRIANEDVAVLSTGGSTPESMRAIEDLYGRSRFEGSAKLLRAVALLDAADVPVEL